MLIIMPFVVSLIVGRCSFLAPLLKARIWTAFSKMLPVLNTLGPAMALWFLIATSGQLTMDFLNQFYYYCGIFCFTLIVGAVVGGLSDFPFQSVLRVPYTKSKGV